LTDVVFESRPGLPDERMVKLWEASNKNPSGYYTHLPPAR
jgi:hypothetical protein